MNKKEDRALSRLEEQCLDDNGVYNQTNHRCIRCEPCEDGKGRDLTNMAHLERGDDGSLICPPCERTSTQAIPTGAPQARITVQGRTNQHDHKTTHSAVGMAGGIVFLLVLMVVGMLIVRKYRRNYRRPSVRGEHKTFLNDDLNSSSQDSTVLELESKHDIEMDLNRHYSTENTSTSDISSDGIVNGDIREVRTAYNIPDERFARNDENRSIEGNHCFPVDGIVAQPHSESPGDSVAPNSRPRPETSVTCLTQPESSEWS